MATRSAVIFDFDGTLTKPYLDFDASREEIGVAEGPVLEWMATMDLERRARAERILMRHEWDAARNAELQEGAADVVASCRSIGYRVAILTRNARPTLDHVLTRHRIAVDAIRTREDGVRRARRTETRDRSGLGPRLPLPPRARNDRGRELPAARGL